MRLVFTALSVSLLTACVPQQMYKWGNYDQDLLASYKDPNSVEQMRLKLEAHVAALESNQAKVAPGLYAELGTLYYQKGDAQMARNYYIKERNAWPESAGLMNSLLQNMDRRDDLPPDIRTSLKLVKSAFGGKSGHEKAIHGRADHWISQAG